MALPTLSEIIESDFDSIYDTNEGAVAIEYQLASDVTHAWTAYKAFLSFDGDLEVQQMGMARGATFTVRKSNIARPAVYDKIKYDSTEYVVLQIIGGNKHDWTLITSSDPRVSPSGIR